MKKLNKSQQLRLVRNVVRDLSATDLKDVGGGTATLRGVNCTNGVTNQCGTTSKTPGDLGTLN